MTALRTTSQPTVWLQMKSQNSGAVVMRPTLSILRQGEVRWHHSLSRGDVPQGLLRAIIDPVEEEVFDLGPPVFWEYED